jgi:hypothetical protein
MKNKSQLQELEEKVNLGLKEAYRKMVEFKKRNNSPLIVSKNGQVMAIPSEDILSETNVKSEFDK